MPSFIKTIKNNLLTLIILFAVFLRFYKINSFPPINPDEAAIGYNAYSLLKTGLDEHGQSWPLHFKSFGDYKPGGYFYLVIPSIKIFGLNTFAVRFPNLILSILSILYFYKLITLLHSKKLAIISTLLLTLSPWHIHFSRGGWESSAALSLTIIGISLFYFYTNSKKPLSLYLSVLMFCLSLYTYHSSRLVTPLIILFLFIQNFKFLLNSKHNKNTIIAIIIAVSLTIPVAVSFLKSGGSARFGGVGITADQGPLWRANELLNHHGYPLLINRITHNKRLLYFLSWLDKYCSHFSFDFLFINGDEVARSKVPEMGQFFLFEIPMFIFGIFILLKSKKTKFKQLIIALLLISPIASSLTFQAPSALRSLPLIIPVITIISLFLNNLTKIIAKFRTSIFILIGLFYFYFFIYYLNSYYFLYPKVYPYAWQYGFDEVSKIIENNKDKYKHIFVTNKYDQPYILYLFYSKYKPEKLHPQIKLTNPDKYGFSTVLSIDNIDFSIPSSGNIPINSLIIAADEKIPLSATSSINFPNNQPAFTIYVYN